MRIFRNREKIVKKNKFLDILKLILENKWFISGSVFYIGFIFTLGMLLPFDASFNVTNVPFGVIPLSIQLYLVNGLYFLVFSLITIIVSFYIFSLFLLLLNLLYAKWLKNTKILVIYKKYYFIIILLLCLVPFASLLCELLYLRKLVDFSSNQLQNQNVYFNGILTFSITLTTFLIKYGKNYSERKSGGLLSVNVIKFIFKILLYIAIIGSFTCATIHIFYQGYLTQVAKFNDIKNNEGKYKGVNIYTDSGVDFYLKVDISKDFFVGLNPKTNSLDLIPNVKIKKIETFSVAVNPIYGKYESQPVLPEQKSALDTINNYYSLRTDPNKSNVTEYLELITKEFYKTQLKYKSKNILEKEWEMKKEFNGNKLIDFIGIDISYPEAKLEEKDNKIIIHVVEYWKDNANYYTYYLIPVDGNYKINRVIEEKQAFKLE
ncbi:hypothetical protein [Paenibacillus qinlingensis]|uniref:hypothetical protein n=1 Tax=Paenibacillus qinlingensis TaxID=1837343 RepID=UPI0015644344|nr:hypothetical protein [Paenibacillus qinlingensis]NQX63262.1 hypothetical protein [Paenibacillus qinlingensis]